MVPVTLRLFKRRFNMNTLLRMQSFSARSLPSQIQVGRGASMFNRSGILRNAVCFTPPCCFSSFSTEIVSRERLKSHEDKKMVNSSDSELNTGDENRNKEKKAKRVFDSDDRKISQIVKSGETDMEEQLTALNIKPTPRLVTRVFKRVYCPRSCLRFFEWAGKQPGYRHNTLSLDFIINKFGRDGDFQMVRKLLSENVEIDSTYSVVSFCFAVGNPDYLEKLIQVFDSLEPTVKKNCYDRLFLAHWRANELAGAYNTLEKMENVGCNLDVSTFFHVLEMHCREKHFDKVHQLYGMMQAKKVVPNVVFYNRVFSTFCESRLFVEASTWLRKMVDDGIGPDENSYDIMISSAIEMQKTEGAIRLFCRALEEGIKPLSQTYIKVLDILLETGGFDKAYSFVTKEIEKYSSLYSEVCEALIRICNNKGLIGEGYNLLMDMNNKGLKLIDEDLRNQILLKYNGMNESGISQTLPEA